MSTQGAQKLYRDLANLEKSASTSRVLNLAIVARDKGHLAAHMAEPMLRSPMLNRSLILKHRLRPEDGDVAGALRWRGVATKVVLPFERSDLGLGGAAFFVGQLGWLDMVAQVAGAGGAANLEHDRRVLEALDELPSLDPFMVREHLRRRRLPVADCYFELSPAEAQRMEAFVAREVFPLVGLLRADAVRTEVSAVTLARILLSSRPQERLAALREALRLDDERYADGIHAWKGFLFYKRVLETLGEPLNGLITGLARLELKGRHTSEIAGEVGASRRRVQLAIQTRWKEAVQVLRRYDRAFERLAHEADARAFRDFLLASPLLFLELGERTGALSHVASYWRFRFPTQDRPIAPADEMLDLLREFEVGLAQAPPARAAA